jgi:membrane-associated protein
LFTVLTHALHVLLQLHGWQAYAIVAGLCFGEAALFLGFVVPGETAVAIGGVLASQHRVSLAPMLILVVVSAIVGDTCGYEVGRHFGGFLLRHRPLRGSAEVAKTRHFIQERGGPSVFLGRFVALLRALVPGIAGMSGMRYRTFLFYNALGALVWGSAVCIAGYEVGDSYQRLIHAAGIFGYVLVGLIAAVAIALVVARRVRHRRGRAVESSASPAHAAGTSGPPGDRPGELAGGGPGEPAGGRPGERAGGGAGDLAGDGLGEGEEGPVIMPVMMKAQLTPPVGVAGGGDTPETRLS